MSNKYHTPVLLNEVIEFLSVLPSGIYVDATLGGGGHSEAILEATGPDSRVIGFDRDKSAIDESAERLKRFGKRFQTVNANFSSIGNKLEMIGINSVDGILADLGVSSHQLDEAGRGFSFKQSAPLDMRMGKDQGLTAYDLVNETEETELANLIFEFGEERLSRRIASAIVHSRKSAPIETTAQLADIVSGAFPTAARRGRIHPATRTFQALRIVVNDELGELKTFLADAPALLNSGGRVLVISYHSLEDRMVKQTFVGLGKTDAFNRITKKTVKASEEEIKNNRRARSAHLRVLERV